MRARGCLLLAVLSGVFSLAPARAGAAGGLPPVKHVFIIMLENKGFDEAFGFNSAAPYLSLTLPGLGAFGPNYYGVTHLSLGNYVALISGQGSNPVTQADCPVFTNVLPALVGANGQASGVGCVYPRAVKTLPDQLAGAGACCKEPKFPNTVSNGGIYPGPGGGHTGAVLLFPYIDPGTIDLTPYNHFAMLRSVEDLFGLGHLGYAGSAGLQSLGVNAFTCSAPEIPRARRGRLPSGSEIKLAVVGQGTAPRPMVELKLWHTGRVSVTVPGPAVRRRGRGRGVARPSVRTVGRAPAGGRPVPAARGPASARARDGNGERARLRRRREAYA